MYRPTFIALRSATRPLSRSLHISSTLQASKPAHEPASTQGHATKKAHETLHKDADVQSASVRAGQDAKAKATGKSSGEDQPFDAARQGNTGGETKGVGATGPFADQVGGQDEPHKASGVKKGSSQTAAGYNITETLKNKAEDIFGGGKETRSFSTSSRSLNGTTPRTDPDGAREPKDTSVKGDQNPHLTHTPGGSQGAKGKGNASPDPFLPSKQKSGSSSTAGQVRSLHTSTRLFADPNAPGVDSPHAAQKDAQVQSGLKSQPRGDDTQHGGAAGEPSQTPTDAPTGASDPGSLTNAPDPGISKGQKEGKVKKGMGVGERKFSTFSPTRASNPPGGYAKTTKHESENAGYNAPATALPSGLKSAYKEQDPAAVEGAASDLTPSSKAPFSSSAVDPPNEALRKQVLDGKMPEKNPQPDAEFGRQGLNEAWKHRKLS